jgi:peroxiredoxin Q/BCP
VRPGTGREAGLGHAGAIVESNAWSNCRDLQHRSRTFCTQNTGPSIDQKFPKWNKNQSLPGALMVSIGKKVASFSLPATGDKNLSLKDYQGTILVIYFYPKDSTPGCTLEGQDFRDFYAQFRNSGAEILGVSRDSVRTHENFKAKQQFPFELLSDSDEILCRQFDVIREKNMYGRKVIGIERSTFLIDGEGVLRREWRKVRVKGHVSEVLEATKSL